MALSKVGLVDVTAITGETALAEQPALSDEILLSDGGTIKRLDVSHISNTPMCDVYNNAAQAIANSTNTECVFNVELLDSDGKFASNRFTPTVAGRYFCFVQVGLGGIDDSEYVTVEFKLNGSQISTPYNPPTHYSTATNGNIYANCTSIIKLDADDYVSAFIAHNEGGSQNTFASQNRFCAFRLTGVDDS